MKSDKSYSSISEVEKALYGLGDVDFLRLDKITRNYAFKLDISIISPENLINEAIDRVLKGSRRWPRDVEFIVFLKNTIRSVASEYRGKESRLFRKLKAEESFNTDDNALNKIIDGEIKNEQKELYDKLWDDFEDDETVLEIFLGYEEGLKGKALRDKFDIPKTEYDSALRRISRYRSKLSKE